MTTLEAVGVTKSYDAHVVLDHVSARFAPGVSVLLGRNGAGKTTFTSIIAGWRHPDAGEVRFDGETGARRASRALDVGLAPQELALYPTLTVEENLRVFADLAGYDARERNRHVRDLTERLAIGELRDWPANTLSGGQQRCVHTAIALIGEPSVALLDEPTVGVDVEHRRALIETVRSLGRDGRTVVYTTHYLAEIDALDPAKIVVLDGGRIRYDGSIGGLLAEANSADIVVEFDRPMTPAAHVAASVRVDGCRWKLRSSEDGDLERVLASLGSDVAYLRCLESPKRDLETAYLRLIGIPTAEPNEAISVAAS